MRNAFQAMNPFLFLNDRLRAAYVTLASAALVAIVLAGPLLARDVPGDAAHADAIKQASNAVDDGSMVD